MLNHHSQDTIHPVRQPASLVVEDNRPHLRVHRRKHGQDGWSMIQPDTQRAGRRVGGGGWVGKSGNLGMRERESRSRDLHGRNIHGGLSGHQERKKLTAAMDASRNAWLEHVKQDRLHEVQARKIPELFRSSAKLLFLSNLRTSTAENVQLFAMLPREIVYMILEFAKPRYFFMIEGWADGDESVCFALNEYYNSNDRTCRIENIESRNDDVCHALLECYHGIIGPHVLR
jgi:hypothetical protein